MHFVPVPQYPYTVTVGKVYNTPGTRTNVTPPVRRFTENCWLLRERSRCVDVGKLKNYQNRGQSQRDIAEMVFSNVRSNIFLSGELLITFWRWRLRKLVSTLRHPMVNFSRCIFWSSQSSHNLAIFTLNLNMLNLSTIYNSPGSRFREKFSMLRWIVVKSSP